MNHVGIVAAFPSESVPDGWLPCDGRALSRTDFPELWQLLKTKYGEGYASDGNKVPGCDFNIPDYRGLFFRGHDFKDPHTNTLSGRDVGLASREPYGAQLPGPNGAVGSLQKDATRRPDNNLTTDTKGAHDHGYTAFDFERDRGHGANYWHLLKNPGTVRTSVDGDHDHQVTGGGDPETRPMNVSIVWVIRAKP